MNKEKIVLCDRKACTGCAACANSCPVDAIAMKCDREGFYSPAIDEKSCIGCGACMHSCPLLNFSAPHHCSHGETAFLFEHPRRAMRLASSSGGAFPQLAEAVLKQGGVVFGAAFDSALQLRHRGIRHLEELQSLCGSKYVQSFIGTTYREVRAVLERGLTVLFCGTPCQILGLQYFLGKEYSQLITCDFICHGVPSPALFEKYLSYLKGRFGKSPIGFRFRDKSKGWHDSCRVLNYTGRKELLFGRHDAFCYFFYQNLSLRECCFSCPIHRKGRLADITLGDNWGMKRERWEVLRDGLSVMVCNTNRGREFLEKEVPAFSLLKQRNISELVCCNPNFVRSPSRPAQYDSFQQVCRSKKFDELIHDYYHPPLQIRGLFLIRKLLPAFVLIIIRYFKSRLNNDH